MTQHLQGVLDDEVVEHVEVWLWSEVISWTFALGSVEYGCVISNLLSYSLITGYYYDNEEEERL